MIKINGMYFDSQLVLFFCQYRQSNTVVCDRHLNKHTYSELQWKPKSVAHQIFESCDEKQLTNKKIQNLGFLFD